MWAGGTKVLLGWERASRGDLAARVLVLLDLEADLARREVRLRVGAMLALCERCVGLGRWCVVQWNVLQVLIESIESID